MLWKVFGRHIRPPLLSGAAHGRSARQGSRRRFSPLRTAAARSCYFGLIRANAELPGGTLGCSTSIRTLDVHPTGCDGCGRRLMALQRGCAARPARPSARVCAA